MRIKKLAGQSKNQRFYGLGGFKSDMSGSKATAVFEYARANHHECVLFDYTAHGASSGTFESFTISCAVEDALAALTLTENKRVVLIGSSMGGWIALRLIQEIERQKIAKKIAGLVLIAPGPDFTEKLMWEQFDELTKNEILEKGYTSVPSAYGEPYKITRTLIEDGRQNLVLQKPLKMPCATHILHGTADHDVPYQHALLVMGLLDGPVTLSLIKEGDHRLSSPEQLEMLRQAIRRFD